MYSVHVCVRARARVHARMIGPWLFLWIRKCLTTKLLVDWYILPINNEF